MTRLSYASLLKYLVVADFKSDINRYFLGVFWWFAEPLMYVGVFYIAFSHLRGADEGYIYFLIVGITTWRWLAGSINAATNSIVGKKRIIGHFSVNALVFTFSGLITNVLKYVVIMLAVVLLLHHADRLNFAGMDALIAWMTATIAFVTACSMVVAYLVVYIPDLRPFIAQALMLLMFLSGVIYPLDSVSSELSAWLQLNPCVHLVSGIRFVLMGESQGALGSSELAYVLGVSALICAVISLISNKVSYDIPKRVLL